MDRWLVAGASAFVLGLLGATSSAALPTSHGSPVVGSADGDGPSALTQGDCPTGTAPDNGACVHLTGLVEDGVLAPARANMHHEKSGRLTQYEQIPRLPDRPADYDLYRYP